MRWGNDETRHWGLDWCVVTALVLSPPLWPGALWHGFEPCVKGDTAAWVLWGDQECPILTLAWLSFLQELPSPHPSC